MSEEKPLHARVAEALGWECWFDKDDIGDMDLWLRKVGHTEEVVPHYDTDWSATGPLIEQYGASVEFLFPGDAGQDGFEWLAHTRDVVSSDEGTCYTANGHGPTPLIAVCNLILALKEAGKL